MSAKDYEVADYFVRECSIQMTAPALESPNLRYYLRFSLAYPQYVCSNDGQARRNSGTREGADLLVAAEGTHFLSDFLR